MLEKESGNAVVMKCKTEWTVRDKVYADVGSDGRYYVHPLYSASVDEITSLRNVLNSIIDREGHKDGLPDQSFSQVLTSRRQPMA